MFNLKPICHDLAKTAKLLFNILFPFLFFYFSYRWTHEIKVTHKEVQDFSIGLGSEVCISSIENPMGTLSSSSCQMLIKEQLA